MIRSLLLACLTACSVGGHRIRHWAHAGAAAGNTLASGHAEHALRTVRVNATLTNVTAQLGTAAFLHCSQPVTKDDPPEVSWLRRRDWHLLTTGKTVFTSDERFQIFHVKAQHDWVLKISFAQLRDRGMYECQISTSAGKLAYFVNLHVVQPVAQIQGPGVYHVERGSSISLVCVITEAMVPPVYVNWKHNDKTLNLYQLRKDIQVGVERAVHETRSTLNITDARDTDSGNYTCAAGNSRPATVHVFVSEGDKMAAIQRRKGGGAASWLGGSVTLLVLLALLVEAVR